MRAPALATPFLIAALALSGCGEPPPPIITEDPVLPPSAAAPPATPAPAANSAMPDMTSYEVAIAIAAANRNRAEAACETLPEANRETCHAGINADWEVTQSALEDLRGEQQ